MNRREFGVGAVASAAALTMSGLAWAQVDDSIKIGLVAAVSGPHTFADARMIDGVKMAVDEINAKGGITVSGKKYKLDLLVEDTQSRADVAVSGAQKLLSGGDVRFIFTTNISVVGSPIANLVSRSPVILIGAFTTMQGLLGKPGSELFFRSIPSDGSIAPPFIKVSKEQLNVSKLGVIFSNDDVSKGIVAAYEPIFKANGVDFAGVEYFQAGTTDFAPVLRKFQRTGIDGIFTGWADTDIEPIVRQVLEIGGLPTKFISRGGSATPGLKFANKIDGFTWQILTRNVENPDDPKVKDFVGRFEKFTKQQVTSSSFWSLHNYDTIYMLCKAMEDAGSVTDTKSIAAKLKNWTYDGVRTLRYDDIGQVHANFDIGVIKGGKTTSFTAPIS